jgi:hypothetical protein
MSCISRCYAEEELKAIRSYDGNFLITAPDYLTCGWAARFAERTRQKVFDLLDYRREWDRPASIVLHSQERETAAGKLKLWTITARKGPWTSVKANVYPNKRADTLVLQVVHLCLADMGGLTLPEEKMEKGIAVAPWLYCGVAENLSRENVTNLRARVAEIVNNGRFLPLEELLGAKEGPSDETERELFFRQSGSVVDYLLHRAGGRSTLTKAITRLRDKGDLTRSLLVAFSRDINTVAQLEEQWKQFAVQQVERTIGGPKMLLSETKAALDRVLTVKIPTVDRDSLEEKIITTDLKGLFSHANRRLVQQIASEKASEVFSMSLRAEPEYGPILQEYLQALTAIAQSNRGEFKRHFALGERMREKLEKSGDLQEGTDLDETDIHGNTDNE